MGSIIQTQWSIDSTIFSSLAVLRRLIVATDEDEVRNSALLAFEALGSSLLLSPSRINEGMQALDPSGRLETFGDFLVTAGLRSGGIAHFMRKEAKRCVPAFVLASSLKTVLSDDQIGDVLYEMMIHQGLAVKEELRCSRTQVGKVVSAVSGFSGPIIPSSSVTYVSEVLEQIDPDPNKDQLRKAWTKLDAVHLAKIYSAVFGAIQKEDIGLVTVTGTTSSIIVASSLLWLVEGEAELIVDGRMISTVKAPRLSIHIQTVEQRPSGTWAIEEWREATNVSKLVVGSNSQESSGDSLPLTSFVPAKTAKQVLMAQYNLSRSEIVEVGRIATALVIVSVEEGFLTQDSRRPGAAPREVRLKDFCQSSYVSLELECLRPYGWDPSEISGAADLAVALKAWTAQGYPGLEDQVLDGPHLLNENPIGQVVWIIGFVDGLRQQAAGSPPQELRQEVFEAAVYIATQSLYTSIVSHFPEQHFFKVPNFRSLTSAGSCMLHWVVRHESLRGRSDLLAKPAIKKTGLMRLIDVTTLDRLRTSCMSSLLPGAEEEEGGSDRLDGANGIHRRDLAFASNGFFAMLAKFRNFSTHPQDAMAIEFKSGYLHFDDTGAPRTSITRIRAEAVDEAGLDIIPETIHAFDSDGHYTGLQDFPDSSNLSIKHFVTQSLGVLRIRSAFHQPGTDHLTPVDWILSLEAIAGATHLRNRMLTPSAEKILAEDMLSNGVWAGVDLISANAKFPRRADNSLFRLLTRTSNQEALRFFAAGRASIHKLYIRHGSTSIVKCLQEALQGERAPEAEGREGYPGVSRQVRDWMHPEDAHQLVSPGWVIIL